jgi:hypothetical protein
MDKRVVIVHEWQIKKYLASFNDLNMTENSSLNALVDIAIFGVERVGSTKSVSR